LLEKHTIRLYSSPGSGEDLLLTSEELDHGLGSVCEPTNNPAKVLAMIVLGLVMAWWTDRAGVVSGAVRVTRQWGKYIDSPTVRKRPTKPTIAIPTKKRSSPSMMRTKRSPPTGRSFSSTNVVLLTTLCDSYVKSGSAPMPILAACSSSASPPTQPRSLTVRLAPRGEARRLSRA
jgi:hypothetical protein